MNKDPDVVRARLIRVHEVRLAVPVGIPQVDGRFNGLAVGADIESESVT